MYNIDEYCTSKMCYKCGEEMVYPSKIKHRNGKTYKSNGVLAFTECNMILNRDVNGAINMHHLLYNYMKRMQRPSWLTRN